MSRRHIIITSIIAGLSGSALCLVFRSLGHDNGDFWWALHMAIGVIEGRDPYEGLREARMVAYPLPIAFVGMLFLWVPNIGASVLFTGCSTGLLVYGILKDHRPWELTVLASAPYVIAVQYAQWGIIIMAMAHLPLLLPTILIKPQIALPIALTRRPTLPALIITMLMLLGSFFLLPSWPMRWLATTGSYTHWFPLIVLPLGPLLLTSLIRWRDQRSWMLTLMAIFPHRALYDLPSLWLNTSGWRQSLMLSILSWVVFLLPSDPLISVALLFMPCLVFIFTSSTQTSRPLL